jgi:hypothetical protein
MSKIIERRSPSKTAKINVAIETAAMRAVAIKTLSRSRFTISPAYSLVSLSS